MATSVIPHNRISSAIMKGISNLGSAIIEVPQGWGFVTVATASSWINVSFLGTGVTPSVHVIWGNLPDNWNIDVNGNTFTLALYTWQHYIFFGSAGVASIVGV